MLCCEWNPTVARKAMSFYVPWSMQFASVQKQKGNKERVRYYLEIVSL